MQRSWESEQTGIYSVAFSPDGRRLATAGDDYDSAVKVWDVATGQLIAHFKGHHSSVLPVKFSRDGRNLASGGGDSSVILWDITERQGRTKADLSPKRRTELWQSLADTDATKVHAAIGGDGALPRWVRVLPSQTTLSHKAHRRA